MSRQYQKLVYLSRVICYNIGVMKGLILAGGKGTRLLPATTTMNKHMVPVLNKPMILYPLETLKYAGIKDIMIVTGGDHIGAIGEFLGDGSQFGVRLTYRVQEEAGGIAQALGLARDFVAGDSVAVILGDNIFDKTKLPQKLPHGVGVTKALFFFTPVKNPARFGVPVFSKDGKKILRVEEKPQKPKSSYAQTGFYLLDATVFSIIKTLVPSGRGELELTDAVNHYIREGTISFRVVQGVWLDAGTFESLHKAAIFESKRTK